MIESQGLTKRYGDTIAVDHLTFTVRAGVVTGFLGPNGAGKSTTMRMIVGLDAPTAGFATVNGRPYNNLSWPLREVGALLEARAIHPGRNARAHLQQLAETNNIALRRVDEVLDLVGLHEVARRRAGKFSLGMGQRLGLAAALLGDPGVLILDEPINGLDPDGIRWVRNLLKRLAEEGRTVFVSSHLMSEMALTADEVVIIGKGRLLAQMSIADLISHSSHHLVRVQSPDLDLLRDALERNGASTTLNDDHSLDVRGMEASAIGDIAASIPAILHELATQSGSLEDAFLDLTENMVEFQGTAGTSSMKGREP